MLPRPPDPADHLPLRPVEFEILLTLAHGERHGYAILQETEARGGASHLETGTMYRALRRLVQGGLVTPTERRARAGRDAPAHLIAAADPLLPPPDVPTLDEILATTTMMAHSVARLFAGCFGFALLLAVSGTYGLMARAIGRRTREIGVRRALGATDATIVRALLG